MNDIFAKFKFWLQFIGWFNIVLGVISALVGFFTVLIIGAIPGAISVFLGVKLLEAAGYANTIAIHGDDEFKYDTVGFIQALYTYFKVSGITIMISIGLTIVSSFILAFYLLTQ